MDKVLVVGLLTIAGVITALILFNGLRESVDKTAQTNRESQKQSGLEAQTGIEIINARTADSGAVIDIWVKNVGIADIDPVTIPDLELFLIDVDGKWGDYIDYSPTGPVTGDNTWSAVGFTSPAWIPGQTLWLRATLGANPVSATGYRISITTRNNVTADYRFQGDSSAVAPVIPIATPFPTSVPSATPTPVGPGVPTPTPTSIPAPTPSGSCSPTPPGAAPVLNSIATNIGYPRQMLAINGDTAGASIVWNANVPNAPVTGNEIIITTGQGGTRYFQIPDNAAPAIYPVALRTGADTSNIVCVTVEASSGTFPAPRIEYIGLNGRSGSDLAVTVSAANLDADATMSVNGTLVSGATLSSALPVAHQLAHIPATFGYPIYHYGQLRGLVRNVALGSTLNVVVTNRDGRSSQESYTLPALWDDLDSDSDGLLDRWEDGVYTAPGGGTVNLAAMGAHKYKMDILVETDWGSEARPGNANYDDGIWSYATDMFTTAPVLNPDGSQGVNLIIDRGQGGAFTQGGQTLVPEPTLTGLAPEPTGPGYVDAQVYYDNFLNDERKGLFHYLVIGSNSGRAGSATTYHDRMLVTNLRASSVSLAGTIVHELGHNLGLNHVGLHHRPAFQGNNNAPNHVSQMNYKFSWGRFPTGCDEAGYFSGDAAVFPTFTQGILATIDERRVDENIGICDNVPIDFNRDGRYTIGPMDLDGNGRSTDVHREFDEWGNLLLDFRSCWPDPQGLVRRPEC